MRKFIGLGLVSLLAFGAVPAQAASNELWGPSVQGTLVEEVIHDLNADYDAMLPVPNVESSTDGTNLVVWLGAPDNEVTPNGTCASPNYITTVACGVVGKIFAADGTALTDTFWISEIPAEYYGGSPEVIWNPDTEQWLVAFDTDARWRLPEIVSTVFMQLVNLDGTLDGETVEVPIDVYVSETDTTWTDVYSDYAGNLNLHWDSELQRYLLLIGDFVPTYSGAVPHNPAFNDYLKTRPEYSGSNHAGFITGNLYDANLQPAMGRDEFTLITNQHSQNTNIVAESIGDGRVGLIYRDTNDVHTARILSLTETSISVGERSTLSLGLSGNSSFAATDCVYNPDSGEIAFAFQRSGQTYLAPLQIGDSITVDPAEAVQVSAYPAAAQLPNSSLQLSRPTIVYSRDTGLYHLTTSVLFNNNDESTALYWTISADDLSTVSPMVQYTHNRYSVRPRLAEYHGHVSIVYFDWFDYTYNDQRYNIYFDQLAIGTWSDSGPEPIVYVGPTLADSKVKAPIGGRVTLSGTRMNVVDAARVDGVAATIVSQTATQLVLTLPGSLRPGLATLELDFAGGTVSVQNALELVAEASVWVKRLSDAQAKLYAKNVVGQGKVRFVLNGREIAWVNALDNTDPKLRAAGGAYYLVRTVSLKPGKNVLEIYVGGNREARVVYSR